MAINLQAAQSGADRENKSEPFIANVFVHVSMDRDARICKKAHPINACVDGNTFKSEDKEITDSLG